MGLNVRRDEWQSVSYRSRGHSDLLQELPLTLSKSDKTTRHEETVTWRRHSTELRTTSSRKEENMCHGKVVTPTTIHIPFLPFTTVNFIRSLMVLLPSPTHRRSSPFNLPLKGLRFMESLRRLFPKLHLYRTLFLELREGWRLTEGTKSSINDGVPYTGHRDNSPDTTVVYDGSHPPTGVRICRTSYPPLNDVYYVK